MSTNPHSPSVLVPQDYEYLFSYCYRLRIDGMEFPGVNLDLLQMNSDRMYSHRRNCHSCGASFNEGCAFLHLPTEKVVLIGHTCAENMLLSMNEASYYEVKEKTVAGLKRIRLQRERRKKMREFLQEYDGDKKELLRALRNKEFFVQSIRNSFINFGNLTPKQISAVVNFHSRQNRKTIPAAVMQQKAVTISAKVLSARYYETLYGYQPKMLVEIENADGSSCRLFGSVPSGLLGINDISDVENLPGKMVTFVADVQQKEGEEGFGFFSRPRKAKFLSPDQN